MTERILRSVAAGALVGFVIAGLMLVFSASGDRGVSIALIVALSALAGYCAAQWPERLDTHGRRARAIILLGVLLASCVPMSGVPSGPRFPRITWLGLAATASFAAGRATERDFARIGGREDAVLDGVSRRHLGRRILTGGVVLLVTAGIAQAQGVSLQRVGLLLAVYTLFGATLLSYGRYTELRRRWEDRVATVVDNTGPRWLTATTALLGAISLIAVVAFAAASPVLLGANAVSAILEPPLTLVGNTFIDLLHHASVSPIAPAPTPIPLPGSPPPGVQCHTHVALSHGTPCRRSPISSGPSFLSSCSTSCMRCGDPAENASLCLRHCSRRSSGCASGHATT